MSTCDQWRPFLVTLINRVTYISLVYILTIYTKGNCRYCADLDFEVHFNLIKVIS